MDSELLPVLKGLGVSTVVLAGVSLNLAITNTAADTTQAGFELVGPETPLAGPRRILESIAGHHHCRAGSAHHGRRADRRVVDDAKHGDGQLGFTAQ